MDKGLKSSVILVALDWFTRTVIMMHFICPAKFRKCLMWKRESIFIYTLFSFFFFFCFVINTGAHQAPLSEEVPYCSTIIHLPRRQDCWPGQPGEPITIQETLPFATIHLLKLGNCKNFLLQFMVLLSSRSEVYQNTMEEVMFWVSVPSWW